MSAPKCTSWLGHKFEPRYSKGPSRFRVESMCESAFIEAAEKYRTITYAGDVCTRCGCIVNAPPS